MPTSVTRAISLWACAAACLALLGCATSKLETRRKEKPEAYTALSPEERQLVDTGQIQTGMSEDAVYLSWGKPSQVLHQQNETGTFTIWLYYGSDLRSDWYWQYRARAHPRGGIYYDPYVVPFNEIRDYVKAELVFAGGKLIRWQTLPRPAY